MSKMPDELQPKRTHHAIALLIDGDNIPPAALNMIVKTVKLYGRLTIRRIYGDWTNPQMKGWKSNLQKNAIQPIQQFRYTTGKNATDSALIIDAMDILHEGKVRGFCIVSSDSDYTRLVTRIHEDGRPVMGIGHKKTPMAFVKACKRFIYLEQIYKPIDIKVAPPKKLSVGNQTKDNKFVKLCRLAFAKLPNGQVWITLPLLGSYLRQVDPNFKPSQYGSAQLSKLIKKYPKALEIQGEGDNRKVRLR